MEENKNFEVEAELATGQHFEEENGGMVDMTNEEKTYTQEEKMYTQKEFAGAAFIGAAAGVTVAGTAGVAAWFHEKRKRKLVLGYMQQIVASVDNPGQKITIRPKKGFIKAKEIEAMNLSITNVVEMLNGIETEMNKVKMNVKEKALWLALIQKLIVIGAQTYERQIALNGEVVIENATEDKNANK